MIIDAAQETELSRVFDPAWSPAVDCELLTLRDQGQPITKIAQALMRNPAEVERRWHLLRVVPGVRAALRKFGQQNASYPTGGSDT